MNTFAALRMLWRQMPPKRRIMLRANLAMWLLISMSGISNCGFHMFHGRTAIAFPMALGVTVLVVGVWGLRLAMRIQRMAARRGRAPSNF